MDINRTTAPFQRLLKHLFRAWNPQPVLISTSRIPGAVPPGISSGGGQGPGAPASRGGGPPAGSSRSLEPQRHKSGGILVPSLALSSGSAKMVVNGGSGTVPRRPFQDRREFSLADIFSGGGIGLLTEPETGKGTFRGPETPSVPPCGPLGEVPDGTETGMPGRTSEEPGP